MKHWALIVILIIICGTTTLAQQKVSGSISDPAGNPLPGVTVKVKGSSVSTMSDAQGHYSIFLPKEKKTLVYEKKGYKVKNIDVDRGVINLTLVYYDDDFFELSLEELLNIEITTASKYSEKKSETPATVVVVTKQDLEERGYVNLYELFNDIPGFDVAATYGYLTQQTYTRGNATGSWNDRTMLMIDGVEANILYAQIMHVSSDFPISAIERIEIIYGPASAIYGPNVFSGIVNIITKSASELENESEIYIRNGIGSDNTRFGEITYVANYRPIELFVSYRRYKSEMFDMTNKPGYFSEEYFGNPRLWGPYAELYPEFENLSDDNALLARVKVKDIEVGYNHLHTKHGNGSEYPYDKTMAASEWKLGRDIAYVRFRKKLNEDFSLSFLGTYQRCGALPDNSWSKGWHATNDWNSERTVLFNTSKFMSTRWGIYQDFEYQATEKLKLNGGIKYTSAEFQKSYDRFYGDSIIWIPGEQWETPTVLFPEPKSSFHRTGNTYNDTEWGSFVQAKLALMDHRLNLVAGLRYDDNTIYGEIISPRLGATFSINKDLHVKTSYGSGFQSPAPRNLYGSWKGLVVNNKLEPDKIQSLDLGFSGKFSDFAADITFFGNQITNSILQGQNLPTKNIFGVECQFKYLLVSSGEFVNNALIELNYSYVNAKYDAARFDPETGRSSDQIGDIAPHKLNLILNANLFRHFHFNLRMNYIDERMTTVTNPIETVDSYFVTHANFQVKNLLDNRLTLFFNVNNVFDTEFYHPGIDAGSVGEDTSVPSAQGKWYTSRLPQPGRRFIGGLSVSF